MLSDDLLKGAEAIRAYIGAENRSQVYHMAATGQIPVIRKGRLIFGRKSELDRTFRSEAA